MIYPQGDNNAVDIEDLRAGYGSREVLKGINANIVRGSFVSLLGPNGAGKTTLLRTLSRHLRKLGGRVYLNGKELELFSQKELAKEAAVVLTPGVSTGMFTGFEFAAMGRYPHTDFMGRMSESDKIKVMEALRLVRAENLSGRLLEEMSDGERQKLFIARALCQEPAVIILDEPTAHLDLKHKIEIMEVLRSSCRKKNITVIASMHDVELASRVSDQVALIKEGGLIAWGPPEEVLNEKNIIELYGMETASFNRTLGTIEIRSNCNLHRGGTNIFCLSGGGSGSVILRSLAREGFSVSAGVLHENDIDFHVGKSSGINIIGAPAYEKITSDMAAPCLELIRAAEWVIDTGFVIKDLNRANLELIKTSLTMGKPVYSLRRASELESLGIENRALIISLNRDYEIIKALKAGGSSALPGV